MANAVGGSVVWNLDVDPKNFNSGLESAERKAKSFATGINKIDFGSMAGSASSAFGSVVDGIGQIIKSVAILGVTGSVGFGAMAKAAFGQVKQVENATFALKAYERDTGKVNQVLSELVGFARSEMGVLFQRQDLFDAASTLKLYGVETQNLTRYTKILSKGVAVGKITFQDLSQILGQVAAEGKLTADSYDVLIRRGIKLPANMRNAATSAEELFKALDKSLPDSILEGRANTIEGRMIRLQSSFRDLGGAILGVDKETSTFIKGGLGDTFIKLLEDLRTQLASPEFKESFKKFGESVGSFAKQVLPLFVKGLGFIARNMNNILPIFAALIAVFAVAKVAAIVFGTAATIATAGISLPMLAIIAVVTLVIGALTFLQLKFNIIGKAVDFLKQKLQPLYDFFVVNILPVLQKIGAFIGEQFIKAWNDLKSAFDKVMVTLQPFMPQLKTLGLIILGIALIPLALIIGGILLFTAVVIAVITVIARLIGWFSQLSASIFSAMVSFRESVQSGVSNAIAWFRGLPGAIMGAIGNVGGILYNAGRSIVQGLLNGAASLLSTVGQFFASKLPGPLQGAFKKALGIHSPSKVFAGYGKNIVQGLTSGIGDNLNLVKSSMNDLSNNLQLSASPLSIDASVGSSASSSSPVINQYNTVNTNVDMNIVNRQLLWELNRA